jgi:hypothetical protein
MLKIVSPQFMQVQNQRQGYSSKELERCKNQMTNLFLQFESVVELEENKV